MTDHEVEARILWVAADQVGGAALAQAEAWLRADELERLGRFRRPEAARLSRIGRALMRRSLASWTGTRPGDWWFELGPHGKPEPRCDAALGAAIPAINLSHCADLVACAIADAETIGVDVEATDRRLPTLNPERFFAPAEVRQMPELESEAGQATFWRLWTAKEAWLKARGTGIAGTLRSFAIELGEPPRLIEGPPGEPTEAWTMAEFRPSDRHRLAVALRCPGGLARFRAEPTRLD